MYRLIKYKPSYKRQESMEFSPVIVFCYNRPGHLNNLLYSLEQNKESLDTDVYIYIDGCEDEKDLKDNKSVIKIAEQDWKFKSKKIVVRNTNFGLRKNIVEGITEVIRKNKKVIVLEEDLYVSPTFLDYMNKSLEKYEKNKSVWHISGYSMEKLINKKNECYFGEEMNCWGWGTWSDRWEHIEYNLTNKISTLEKEAISAFNFYGLNKNNLNQILLNEKNIIKTWGIFWYQTIFLNNGLCLNPSRSLVRNEGFDGTGVHKSTNNFYSIRNLNSNSIIYFPKKIKKSFIYEKLLMFEYFKYNLKDYITYHSRKLKKMK